MTTIFWEIWKFVVIPDFLTQSENLGWFLDILIDLEYRNTPIPDSCRLYRNLGWGTPDSYFASIWEKSQNFGFFQGILSNVRKMSNLVLNLGHRGSRCRYLLYYGLFFCILFILRWGLIVHKSKNWIFELRNRVQCTETTNFG